MPPPNGKTESPKAVMTFLQLHEGLDCNCLDFDGVSENTTDRFARRISKKTLRKRDFQSYHELNVRKTLNDDKARCMYRGVSIQRIGDEERIKQRYYNLFAFSPQGAGFYCEFTFKPNAGKVWGTPSRDDPFHHTLFKCDAFTTGRLKVIKVVSILDNVGD